MANPGRAFTQPGLSWCCISISAKGPISRILFYAIIPLGGASPLALISDLPGGSGNYWSLLAASGRCAAGAWLLASGFPPYLVLLRVGFTLPPPLLAERCALTAPFHPYPGAEPASWRGVALRRGVAEAVCSLWHWPSTGLDARVPDVIRHTALRSSDFPPPEPLACASDSGSDRPVLLPPLSLQQKWIYQLR